MTPIINTIIDTWNYYFSVPTLAEIDAKCNVMDIARMQLENIIILAVCLAIMAYLYYDRKSDERKDCAPPKKSLYLRLSDNLMSLVLILTLCTLVSYKMTKRAVVYMAVPCHVNLTLQIVISLMNSNTKLCRTLSTMMLAFSFCGPLAMIAPETDNLILPFEKEVFWFDHVLLMVFPIYRVMTRGPGCQYSDLKARLITTLALVVYHFGVLASISMYTGIDMNHNLCPVTMDFILAMGQWHRVICLAMAIPMFIFLAYAFQTIGKVLHEHVYMVSQIKAKSL